MNTLFSPTVTEALAHGITVRPMDVAERIITLPCEATDAAPRAWILSAVEWLDMTTAVDAAFEFLANPYCTEAPTKDVLAFSFNAAMYCVDHGKVLPHGGEGDDYAYPTHSTDAHELSAVEYCDHGHSFCGNCGSDLDTLKGSQDADLKGHFSRCWNCHEEAVYVDGEGYVGVYRWSDVLDRLKVQVYGPEVMYVTTDRYTTVGTVIDESGTNVRTLRAFLCFIDLDPSAGTVLVLANGDEEAAWHAANESAEEYFMDADDDLDQDDEEVMSDFRASVGVVEVPTDQVWFSSK